MKKPYVKPEIFIVTADGEKIPLPGDESCSSDENGKCGSEQEEKEQSHS